MLNLVSWEVCCYRTLEVLKGYIFMFFLIYAVSPALAANPVKNVFARLKIEYYLVAQGIN